MTCLIAEVWRRKFVEIQMPLKDLTTYMYMYFVHMYSIQNYVKQTNCHDSNESMVIFKNCYSAEYVEVL